jgi:8-oxo-dGTP pyrophosphatase MutT (NUDIX family)
MNKQGPQNQWIQDSERTVLDSPIMSIHELSCHSTEDSRRMKFYTMRSRNWCNIIPVTEDGKVVLIRQYRIGIAEDTIEIPGGVVDPTDPHAQATAIRELAEETGYVPLPHARCVELGWAFANPAIQNNRTYSFVVGPVRKQSATNLDPGEMIETCEVPISEIPNLILNGTINHALMLNTFFFLAMREPSGLSSLETALQQFT